MPDISFYFIQLNFVCCTRRRRHSNHDNETTSDIAERDTASDNFSDFELVQSSPSPVRPVLSSAKLRWVRAVLAAILRQKIVRAYNALTRLTKRNKAIGVPNPVASRLWGQTGNWLQRHKL